MKVLFGVLIGVLVAKLLRRAMWRRHGGGFHHGPFGGGLRGPFGHGCWWRRGRGARAVWLLNELDLDPRQKDELGAVWLSLRQSIGAAQVARWRGMTDVVEVATAEPLDRTRLDEVASKYGEAQAKLAQDIVAGVTRMNESLRPEQRSKLRELVERAGLWRFSRGTGAPLSDGPYR